MFSFSSFRNKNKNKKTNRVICIGSASKDVFFPTDDGVIFNTPDDVMSQRKISFELGAKYQVEDRHEVPGGVAANVSQGLSRLGIGVACFARVGSDDLGKWILDELVKEKVDITLMQKDKKSRSDLSLIIVDKKSGERTIFFNRDANENLKIIPSQLRSAEYFFISSLNGSREIPWQNHLKILMEIAKKNEIKIIFNPGQRNIKDDVRLNIQAIAHSHIVVLNKDEAIEIVAGLKKNISKSNLNDEIFLMKSLHNLGCQIVALTDGKRGAWVFDGERMYFSNTTEKRPVETTGAGDSFSSGFIAAYLKERDLQECLRWGMANGESVVKYYGAKEGLLNTSQIKARSKKIKVKIL